MKKKESIFSGWNLELYKNWQLYLLLILPVAYVIIFSYIPMAGLQIAFKDVRLSDLSKNLWTLPFHRRGAFFNFEFLFVDPMFFEALKNTIILSVYELVVTAIMPVIFALILNSLVNQKFKKTVQFITYAPHFISTVVMVGILFQIFHYRNGIITNAIVNLTGQRIDFLSSDSMFRHMYTWSGVLQ
jgi:ABC-type polysaccharide transport system permease subunit